MRVLQVEDDAEMAKSVELMLHADGHQCETVALGQDAVRRAQENDYDIILLDIMLPDIDGYDVLQLMRQCDVRAPVLIQSGLVSNARDRGALGVAESLLKPFGRQELSARISAAVGAAEPKGGAGAAAANGHDRRGAPRAKTFKAAEMIYDDAKCTMDCAVLNLSDRGAAIRPADMLNAPDRFTLRVKFGPIHECEVCWRHGTKLGVRFLDD